MNYTKNYKNGGGKKTQRRSQNQTQQSTIKKSKKIKFSDVCKHVCDWFEQKTGQKCSTVAISTALLSIVGGLTYNRYVNQKSSNKSPNKQTLPKARKKKVFIAVQKNTITCVSDAWEYQTNAFYDFMNDTKDVKTYKYGNDIKFEILKFNSTNLKLNYDRFCVLKNESGEFHILSDDETLLRGFTGWRNRLTN